jgi:hypothetical protein
MLVSLLDGVPRPLSIGDELYTSFSGPFGGNFEEQIINNVELYGTPSIATAEALVLRLRERSGESHYLPLLSQWGVLSILSKGLDWLHRPWEPGIPWLSLSVTPVLTQPHTRF